MHLRIRADILNAAIHAAASTSVSVIPYKFVLPEHENDRLTFNRLAKGITALETEYMYFSSQWDGDHNPAMAFFSINPPGTWMRLRSLIGQDAMELSDLDEQLDSEEALGIVLQRFIPELERQQDEWNARQYIR